MSSRVTDLDRHIAKRMKLYREANPDANMSKLAGFVGIKYQSYQAMEKGEVSIRVSTVQRLATFYGVSIEKFIGESPPGSLPNIEQISYIVAAVKSMPPEGAREVLNTALSILRG